MGNTPDWYHQDPLMDICKVHVQRLDLGESPRLGPSALLQTTNRPERLADCAVRLAVWQDSGVRSRDA